MVRSNSRSSAGAVAKAPSKTVERAAKAERAEASGERAPNPVWFKPLMFGFMLLGLAWLLVFYISGSQQWPIPGLGNATNAIGNGIMLNGFLLTTR